jgi:hypothetical protein
LLTTTMRFPLSTAHPAAAAINADIGISARIGLRGGASLDSVTSYGTFGLRARVHDIVTTQLTNRIVLDRLPEITYGSPMLPLFPLPGGRKAGLLLGASIGRLSERTVGGGGGEVNATRSQVEVLLTTRAVDKNGPYLELFGRDATYTRFAQHYGNTGFEVGYYGKLLPRVHGLFSYRSTSLSGATPFQFDQVEIARELRSTFDIRVTPRYLIPIDLRYDLDLGRLRDERFGILRNYKNFAYGLTYQTAQHNLRLEIRNGF